jgi:hypothetical protein
MTDLDKLKKRLDRMSARLHEELRQAKAQGLGPDDPLPAQYVGSGWHHDGPTVDDPSVMVINVEDYPGLDPSTEAGKDQLSSIATVAAHTNPGKQHFLFKHKGEQIGQMIMRGILDEEQ